MIFRQLFEQISSSYTYLLACPDTREAILIDPVLETVERDLEVLQSLNLKLHATLDTHIHADHITGSKKLSTMTGCKIGGAAMDDIPFRDFNVCEGETFHFGNIKLQPLHTPGHTPTHHSYLIDTPVNSLVFTGDSLLIESCGRTDFQDGDASQLFESIHKKLFTLPDDTLIYPGHDYQDRFVSTIRQEKKKNPRVGQNKTCEEFVDIMKNLNLPYPKKIDFAVSANQQCGIYSDELLEQMKRL